MEKKAAANITALCIRRNIVEASKAPIFEYAFEVIISSLICILMIEAVSVFSGSWLWGVMYMLGIIPLRVNTGGFHANTHNKCCFVFISTFLAFSLIFYFVQLILLPISVVCFITVIVFAPVEVKNKPLDNTLRKKNRKRAIIIAGFDFFLNLLSAVFAISSTQAFRAYCCGEAAAVLLMLMGKCLQSN